MHAKKVDAYTVEIALEKPLSSILFFPKFADYAGGFIVCKRAVEAVGEESFSSHPVGTGPFRFESYEPGQSVRLRAHEEYFRGRPILDAVEIRYVPDVGERTRGLANGELDVIVGSEAPEWFAAVEDVDGTRVDVFGVGQPIFLNFNTTHAPLDDVRVRRAIAYALDRELFRNLWAEDVAENVFSPVPAQLMPGGLTAEEARRLGVDYAFDPQKAAALLAEAGHEEGFTLDVVTSERRDYAKIYESLRDQLRPLGINVEIMPVEHAEMHKAIRADRNPIVVYNAWRPNADVYLTRFFHSDSIVVTGTAPDTNFSHYDQIDPLIEAARRAREPTDQIRLWKQAQIKILEDMAAYPLHYVKLVYARKGTVDYGHELAATFALYPQFTEKTRLLG
jgi:peptide/nickel transport system substrate-binding protein